MKRAGEPLGTFPVGRWLGCVLLAFAAVACRSGESPSLPKPTPDPYPKAWRFRSEEEWLVAQTMEAIGGIALYASGRSATAPVVVSVVRAPFANSLDPRRFTVH